MKYGFRLAVKPLLFVGKLFVLTTLLHSSYLTTNAQGNLLINPKRIVFEGQQRIHEISLANIGKDSARYLISMIQIRMKSDGSFEEIAVADSGQNFADKHLRIFPRTVSLAPNEAQTVKVQVSQINYLEPGEYRSHLYFRSLSQEKPLGEQSGKDSTTVAVRLTAVFGISIPVIIRSGESTTRVSLSDLELTEIDMQPVLKARFNRTGNMSVYGDLTINHIAVDGKVTRAGVVKGISVYTPNSIRDLKVKLDTKSGLNYHSGKLAILYTSQSKVKAGKFAEAELILN